ncbi:LOW QUALITY PROTEIN: protein NEN2-like [Rhodamnia argentea]|uniref:LOW QUALITY PROTEIN: protein NEN2-like n=1 Tax=Rhodamnia argentea TaxID=178133 RepID=A0ABM3HN90_9MYRT|nr:LOW QUALITY PROTEIN: protein NEN2-like [Rhodamnia argentea]
MDSSQPELVIFDVETVKVTKAIIEFGAIIVCPQTLVEKEYFSSLARPQHDWEFGEFKKRRNGLNREDIISSNIFFSDIAHTIYDMLHGRIWVGHNIKDFDSRIVKDAFHEIGRSPPEPSGVIDTMELCEHFRGEAGNVKMATLAAYFDLGEQKHRSLDDVQLNLRLFRRCAAVFFLTESLKLLRAQYGNTDSNKVPRFLEPEEYKIPSLRADYDSRDSFDQVRDVYLPISCAALNVKLGPRSWNDNGRPKVSFVVHAPDNLSTMLEECDRMLQRLFQSSGIDSEWRNVVVRAWNPPTVRLSIANTADKQTIVCKRTDSGEIRRLVFDESKLETLLPPSTKLDAYFFLETYHCQGYAGIRLVAHKLIIHP